MDGMGYGANLISWGWQQKSFLGKDRSLLGKNTLYGIDNTEISETVLKYQISDFP